MPFANPAYYLDDYSDEVMPTLEGGLTLASWAAWLAQGGEKPEEGEEPGCWTFDPPLDGAIFKASRMDFDEDIRVEHRTDADGEPTLLFSRESLSGYDFAAVRFGPGMGWDADAILDPTGDLDDQLANKDCPLVEVGEEENIAVAKTTDIVLVYRADPPRLEEQPVQ